MLAVKIVEVCDHVGMRLQCDPGLCALLKGEKPQLLEPRRVRQRERLVSEVCERLASPELECLVREDETGARVTRVECAPASLDCVRKPVDVQGLPRNRGGVPRRTCPDHVCPELFPKPG